MDIYLDWNGDLVLTPNGSIQTAVGWDNVRQRIIRHMITNGLITLPDGTTLTPDYFFHVDFGNGLGSMIGQAPSAQYDEDLKRIIRLSCLEDAAVDPAFVPQVTFNTPRPDTREVHIVVKLKSGQYGQIFLRDGS